MATTIPAGIDMAAILAQPPVVRVAICDAIAASLEAEDTADDSWLTDEVKAELDRRIADSDAHPEKGIPMEVVFERLANRVVK